MGLYIIPSVGKAMGQPKGKRLTTLGIPNDLNFATSGIVRLLASVLGNPQEVKEVDNLLGSEIDK